MPARNDNDQKRKILTIIIITMMTTTTKMIKNNDNDVHSYQTVDVVVDNKVIDEELQIMIKATKGKEKVLIHVLQMKIHHMH